MMDALTTNKSVLSWIEDKVNLVKPDKIVWIDGSKEQIEAQMCIRDRLCLRDACG